MNINQVIKDADQRGFLVVGREIQIAWVAFIGWTRMHFMVHTALACLVTPYAYWVGYQTNLGAHVSIALAQSQQLTLTYAILLMMRWFNWMCVALPPLATVAFLVCFLTGMFKKPFWDAVTRLREQS